ncbi:MAG: four helix bundle suffix domain-containing protein [Candidatus Cloacimonetes bacterium]|nr:four helix bundle suffix domain-containing protein [Candidatus Cloacimonadota bacterium]
MTGFLSKKGNYRELLSYKKSLLIYDATYCFCQRFLDKYDRTIDQMVQAARSGKQNIIEGAKAAMTSTATELKLTNVARASLEELLEDYLDFIRVRNLRLWRKDSKEALYVRKLAYQPNESYDTYREFLETRSSEVCANIIICLIHQCNYLLNQQIRRLEDDFIKSGGIREQMYKARNDARTKEKEKDKEDAKR